MEIPRIRRPTTIHTLDQVVGQARAWADRRDHQRGSGRRLRAVVGLGAAKTDDWKSGRSMTGVWFSTPQDAAHQAAMHCVPDGRLRPRCRPLASGKLGRPHVALMRRPAR